jgi:hypothetical protein
MKDEPFWMTGNRDGSCAECEDTFNKGDRIVWDPAKFKAYCKGCGSEMIGDDPKLGDEEGSIAHARKRQSESGNKDRSKTKSKKKKESRA